MESSEVKTNRLANLEHMFRSLRGRNYSLFFAGQGISVIGTWMQSTALSMLVYYRTDSKLMLGVVAFVSTIFSFLVSPIAGVFTDRWNRHRVMIVTQALSMAQAGVLAFLTLTGRLQVWHILALATFIGLINSVDIPNRQTFVVQLVEKREDLPNAIALNSFMFNGARLIGPPVAGLIVWLSSEGMCFLINAVSYVAVIAALLAMKIERRDSGPRKHILRELRDGFTYAFGFPPIRIILLLLGTLGLIGLPYATLLPVFAKDILHGDAMTPAFLTARGALDAMAHRGYTFTQGLLIASAGVGAIVAAIHLASRRSVRGLGMMIGVAPILLGAGLIAFGGSRWVYLSLPMLAIVGFGQMIQMAGSNTLLQTIVDDDKRGRVMSFYTIAFLGTAPFGSLLAGWSAQHIGAPATVMISGAVCVLTGVLFLWRLPHLRKHIRPIYVKMGIISDTPPIPKAAVEEDINGNQ